MGRPQPMQREEEAAPAVVAEGGRRGAGPGGVSPVSTGAVAAADPLAGAPFLYDARCLDPGNSRAVIQLIGRHAELADLLASAQARDALDAGATGLGCAKLRGFEAEILWLQNKPIESACASCGGPDGAGGGIVYACFDHAKARWESQIQQMRVEQGW